MEGESSAPQPKQKKGIKKLWAKIRSSLKEQSSSSQTVTSPSRIPTDNSTAMSKPVTEPAPASPPVEEPTQKLHEPAQDTEVEASKSLSPIPTDAIEVDDDNTETSERPEMTRFSSSRAKYPSKAKLEQAQAVLAKYNFKYDPSNWQPPNKSGIDRVEKRPRMRVRYTCHQCQNVFGREKTCNNCQHLRCLDCVRYPVKKTAEQKARKREQAEALSQPLDPIDHGACHECKTDFEIGDLACPNCQHSICERCVRETFMGPASIPPAPAPATIVAAA